MDVAKIYRISFNRIGGTEEMMRLGLYMNDLSLHDMSRERDGALWDKTNASTREHLRKGIRT